MEKISSSFWQLEVLISAPVCSRMFAVSAQCLKAFSSSPLWGAAVRAAAARGRRDREKGSANVATCDRHCPAVSATGLDNNGTVSSG